MARAKAQMIPETYAARAAELVRGMAVVAARLMRDWPKEHPPANPACEAMTSTGEQKNG